MPGQSIRGGSKYSPINTDKALKAIETVKKLLSLLSIGPLCIHRGPRGELHIDVPLMYDGIALDRIHYDPIADAFSPKGRPVHVQVTSINEEEIRARASEMLKELRVIDAVEYREPEKCWVVPIAWKNFIVAHIKVDHEGEEIVPDYGLTVEIGGRIV